MTPAPAPAPERRDPALGCLYLALFLGASLYIVAVTAILHAIGWTVDQVMMISGTPLPWYAWPLIAWGHTVLLAIPVAPLAFFVRAPRDQAVYRAWLAAIVFTAVLAPVRVLPATWSQAAALGQIGLTLACSVALILAARMRGRGPGLPHGGVALALALAPLAAAPWLLWGALGSPLDTLLALLAGLCLGLFAGLLLGLLLLDPLAEHTAGPGRDLLYGGFAASILLFILGAGFGFGGGQLLLMIALPPLGFAALALGRAGGPAEGGRGRAWLPIALFTGLLAAAPKMFVDPEELTLILGGNEILSWALNAALLAVAVAMALGVALLLLRNRLSPGRRGGGLWWGGAALSWLGALALYFFLGQPGFYGENLFVIWREQADLTPAAAIAEREARLAYVYGALTAHADDTQAEVRGTLDRLGVAYTPFYLVNALEVRAGPLLRLYLASRPEVDRVLDNPVLRPLPAPVPVTEGEPGAPGSPPWNITAIGADRAWAEFGAAGAGIVVGQSDSGVQGDHPALREGYRGRATGDDYNWLDPWNGTEAPTDLGGHGTHTLGSVLGRGGIGVAPEAEWFACANLARNLGNPALYLTCMQFMLAPYPQAGDPFRDGDPARAAHVLNNSWGCPPLEGCDAGALHDAARALRAAGIFVVASAGNEGPRCGSVSHPIALYDEVFSVGAIDRFGEVASFSSRGPVEADGSGRVKPDLLAPGVDVFSALPGSGYGANSGTSMAGPHAAGVVALMWSAQPGLIGDVERTAQILRDTADPYTGPGAGACPPQGDPNSTAGYGVLNAYEAVRAALEVE